MSTAPRYPEKPEAGATYERLSMGVLYWHEQANAKYQAYRMISDAADSLEWIDERAYEKYSRVLMLAWMAAENAQSSWGWAKAKMVRGNIRQAIA